jgi:hypothetical protein
MKTITLLLLTLLLPGCANRQFSVTNDVNHIFKRHRFVADVTCISSEPRHYNLPRDDFHMLAMPPRVRWTVEFRIDRVIKGEAATNSFRLNDARNTANPFDLFAFGFETSQSYLVGFDSLTKGEVCGLEILGSNAPIFPKLGQGPTLLVP